MARHFIAPVLALAATAAAEVCSIASSSTTTISTSADATGLATCDTFTGNIAIGQDTTEPIALDGISKIVGNLVADNATQLTSLTGAQLQSISGQFYLLDCQALDTLTFPSLTSVGSLGFSGLAALQGLSFASGGITTADNVVIVNTRLGPTLTGFNLDTVQTMEFANNYYLKDISASLTNVTTKFLVTANGDDCDVSLPNLISVAQLSIANVTTIDLSALSSVTGSFNFMSNFGTSLTCPNLTSIGETFTIADNNMLTSMSFPELKSITGGFNVQNNSALTNGTGFQTLQTVGGAVSINGPFTTFPMPDLKQVSGTFEIESSATTGSAALASQCSGYEAEQGHNNVLEGSVICSASAAAATSTSSGGATGTGGTSSTTTSKSDAHSHLISGTTGILGVVAAIFGML